MNTTSSTFLDVAYLEVKQNGFLRRGHSDIALLGAMRGRNRFLAICENEDYPAQWLVCAG